MRRHRLSRRCSINSRPRYPTVMISQPAPSTSRGWGRKRGETNRSSATAYQLDNAAATLRRVIKRLSPNTANGVHTRGTSRKVFRDHSGFGISLSASFTSTAPQPLRVSHAQLKNKRANSSGRGPPQPSCSSSGSRPPTATPPAESEGKRSGSHTAAWESAGASSPAGSPRPTPLPFPYILRAGTLITPGPAPTPPHH